MRIWLDDVRPMPEGYDVHCFDAASACALIAKGGVTAISFDHDLGPEEAGTGYDVALFIEEWAALCNLPRILWQVHSANPVGAQRIAQAMMSAERIWSCS